MPSIKQLDVRVHIGGGEARQVPWEQYLAMYEGARRRLETRSRVLLLRGSQFAAAVLKWLWDLLRLTPLLMFWVLVACATWDSALWQPGPAGMPLLQPAVLQPALFLSLSLSCLFATLRHALAADEATSRQRRLQADVEQQLRARLGVSAATPLHVDRLPVAEPGGARRC
ncbi:hypothetical protein OOT46_18835 [Aquabacterium sp. A7-Y]|uniref:hypothetical protein n=1 Tax=Aquabacterium sp. A7-Y TaxID=1349605 RepID=UPI00223CA190|nr:hypothetical protein [Aquabacterium sp. A7-Y]MCW7539895.1 hypothetical protein [Aquabacterium sp. A7-Y]